MKERFRFVVYTDEREQERPAVFVTDKALVVFRDSGPDGYPRNNPVTGLQNVPHGFGPNTWHEQDETEEPVTLTGGPVASEEDTVDLHFEIGEPASKPASKGSSKK